MENNEAPKSLNFIEEIIDNDLKTEKNYSRVHTRFPPEPNGYLHIGHAKSICLNFGLAEKFNGKCNLRFDDTNPEKEDVEYVDSIMEDISWLGFRWNAKPLYASDYFEQLFQWALHLIENEKAYVCDMSMEEISRNRGTPVEPGKESPFRNRSASENRDLFQRMKNGEFPDGIRVLRAKIDMASPNMHMRDPVLYRIKHMSHHRTGDRWCIYPTYDFAHGQSDFIEGITHSICTLEFEVHRPLYDWLLDNIVPAGKERPKQIEFARLNLSYTVMSKRMLRELVTGKFVAGWDDPRMPTISGLRRRGYTPGAIRTFAKTIGVAKRDTMVDMALLEHCIRDDLNKKAKRALAVLAPLKIIIDNYPENQVEEMDAVNNPEDSSMDSRKVPFSRELYIERNDFMEDPPRKFFRLSPGSEVRLRYSYIVKCNDVIKNEKGEVTALHCTYDPGSISSSRKVKGTIHWVSAAHAQKAEIRLYDRLFNMENPYETREGEDFTSNINPESLKIVEGLVEPSLGDALPGDSFQFERQGYFCADKESSSGRLIFNRTVSLRDSWAKISSK